MAIRPLTIEAPATVAPARFGLLDTFQPRMLPEHGGMAGVEYDSDFCGVARPWTAPCTTPADLGTVTVVVDDAREASITADGAPDGNYVIAWGDGNVDAGGAIDGNTNTYAEPGTYTVTVTGEDGYFASVVITVEDGSASGPFVADARDTKVADDGVSQVTGSPIVIYHLFSCRGIGGIDLEARAARALETGASRAVEQGFADILGGAAVALTSGTPVGAVEGLALLEQEGGESYGGQRVIHADLATATVLISQSLVREVNGRLETMLGSIVVAGPGYRNATTVPSQPGQGAHWMFATGAVNLWADATIKTPLVIDNPATGVYDNEFRVLVERTFVPTYECFAVAAEVTLEA